ncbi:nitroreductase family protein [Paraflavitalea pollutisoli]|uniref:nitroreductase family protein n=1 Tax=Paraflavitalea pollutisoli TaxID=3034143 RepID=UPI0023EAF4C5|nr:nitroreductase family protein [Paraflavitalea sp. H1-2-19X]
MNLKSNPTLKKIARRLRPRNEKVIQKQLSKLCYRSRLLSSVYYFLFDRSFSREYQAVLAGKVKHLKEAERIKANYFLLVRNTHRIEKGLLMRPKRNVFAKDYIAETVDSFEGVWKNQQDRNNPQIKWFTDVLTEYFAGASSDPEVAKSANRFHKIIGTTTDATGSATDCKAIPYVRLDQDKSNISYDELYKLSRQRRSVRWFLDKQVPRELIDKAILVANQSPSACNRQPFEFRVFDNPEMVKEVAKLPMGTKGYEHSIQTMIVIVGNLDAYYDERDRHVIYIDASLASMSLMLALETLGLSSCAINWPDLEPRERKMEKFLALNKHQRPIMCLGIGYPDPEGMVAFSEKRPLHQIRSFNHTDK